MAEEARPALGLSIGATNLAAVTADHAISRKPVLTLYRQRPPEVGVPSENPRLDERGLVISDFVDRVGDPIGIVAADGSMHRSEALIADGLRALAYTATGGRSLPENVAVTYPAHWGPKAVDALGAALSRVAEWSNRAHPLTLIPDAAATLFTVRANPGIPARGIVALCDFGGSGTTITLVDAAGDYQPVATSVRFHDFSGDLIDQALLTAVMSNLPASCSFDPAGTSAIGSLSRLRTECRVAKEQLSSTTVATLTEELPGMRGDIRLTRNELDDAIRNSLKNFVDVLDLTLVRNGIRGSDLVAVVSVGGGAHIPAVTTMLSGHLRVPVVTTQRPHLTAAIGGALRAARGPGDTTATRMTPAAPATALAPIPPAPEPKKPAGALVSESKLEASALAWSQSADESRSFRMGAVAGQTGYTSARPALKFEHKPEPQKEDKASIISSVLPWQRVPGVVIIAVVVAVVLVGVALAIALDSDSKPAAPGVNTSPASSAPASPPPNTAPAPAGQGPNSGEPAPPPPATAAPPPPQVADSPPPPPVPVANQPPAPAAPPAPPAPRPFVPRLPAIPPLPHIPGIGAAIPGLGQLGH